MNRIYPLKFAVFVVALSFGTSGIATAQRAGDAPSAPIDHATAALSISSSAFPDGASIPLVYTCKGAGESPPLSWQGVPSNAVSLAIIVDDPDAPSGTWVHWVIYNIPAGERSLGGRVPRLARLADGSLQGQNSGGSIGYQGPCPPSGTHHYFFKLYALDSMLSLAVGASKSDLLSAMNGHIISRAEVMGTVAH